MSEKLVARANAVMSPLNIQPGLLTYDHRMLSFRSDKGGGFIDIPWRNVTFVSVEQPFKVYYRGLIVATDDGQQFEFIGGKVRQAIPFLQQVLRPDQIRRRKGIFER